MQVTVVYKIVPQEIWQKAEAAGIFGGAAIDLTDGFIHFSTASQARRTAELYFKGVDGLLLVAVDAAALGDALVFEPSRDGDLFPHLYGLLPMSAVLWQKPLSMDADGTHQFPEL